MGREATGRWKRVVMAGRTECVEPKIEPRSVVSDSELVRFGALPQRIGQLVRHLEDIGTTNILGQLDFFKFAAGKTEAKYSR